MAEKKMSLTLAITEAGKETREEVFSQDSVTIGGGDTADLNIAGENVSDIHAMFDMSRNNEVVLMDLGSSSGTFVNDKKVNKQKLEEGDEVKLGDVKIAVKAIGEPGAAEETAAAVAEEPAAEEEKVEEEAPAEEAAAETEEAKDAPAEEEKAEEAAAAPEEEPKEEAKAEAEPEEKKAAKEDTADEEKKALEEKKAAFEAVKAKSKKKLLLYDLEVIPKEIKAPKGKKPVFEAREILWGTTLIAINHYSTPETLTFGEKKSNTFFLSNEYLPSAQFEFAKPGSGNNYDLNFTDQMDGWVQKGDERTNFGDLIKKKKASDKGGFFGTTIEPGMAAAYKFDEMQYYLRYTDTEKLAKVPFTKRIDYPITSLFVVLFLFYTVMTIYLKSLPAPEVADILDAPERFAKLVLEPVEMEEPPPPEEEKKVVKESEEKAIGEEGKIGKKESMIDKTEGSAKKRLEDEKVANSSGILGALDRGMENMDRLFGGGGLGAGLEKNLGMLEGISGLDMRGAGGLGSRGSGMGGGGMALGIGGLGTKGRGGGKRGKGMYGIGAAGNLKKRSANINIRTGNPTIAGALDKSIIARIIKKHYSQIRYCYQKELNKNPKLYGKITIKFTISGRGTVSSSVVNVSTMKNFAVEQCVAKTIKRIIFPQPKGGGIVVVTYPFIFKAEGA